MSERITVVIDDKNHSKLRKMQGKLTKESVQSISFSRVLNTVLEEGLKKF